MSTCCGGSIPLLLPGVEKCVFHLVRKQGKSNLQTVSQKRHAARGVWQFIEQCGLRLPDMSTAFIGGQSSRTGRGSEGLDVWALHSVLTNSYRSSIP